MEAIDAAFIELRNLLDDHAQNLLEQLEENKPQLFRNASAIQIDYAVIPILYCKSPLVREFDDNLVQICNTFYKAESLDGLLGYHYEWVIWRLNFLGLRTAADVAAAYEENRDIFIKWLEIKFRRGKAFDDGVSSGSSLIQLAYFLAAKKGYETYYQLVTAVDGRVFDIYYTQRVAKEATEQYLEALAISEPQR